MIETERLGDITVLRLAHGKVNAIDLELAEAVTDAVQAAGVSGAHAVVLAGSGRAFSAGVDLRRVLDGGADYVATFVPALVDMFDAVFRTPIAVVAAVNGYAIAGGCILAASADHCVLARDAGRIGATELSVGVPFPTVALEIVRHACGAGAEEVVFGAQL